MPFPLRPVLVFFLALCGCAAGPDYRPPVLPGMPAAFRHAEGWQAVEPQAAQPGAAWWAGFDDPVLDALLRELALASPGVAEAEARYRQAAAALRATRAGLAPVIGAGAAASRGRNGSGVANAFAAELEVSWMPDLWGRMRRQSEADAAELAASAADAGAVRLALQATLARHYVQLRAFDLQRDLLLRTEEAYRRSLELTRNQYLAGLAARADEVQATMQLEGVRTELLALDAERAAAENAIAVLAGRPPAAFALGADGSLPRLPPVPAAVPASLLTRRPDLAVAERRVAAANARIGVAEAAWFPDLTLGLSGGFQAERLGVLLNASNRVWSLGPALAATLFDGGARAAGVEQAAAAHDEAAAAWRGAVLAALQEAEDAFARLRALEALALQQDRVVALAGENERIVTQRYRSGLVSFLELAVAQNTTLAERRAALAIARDRLDASVALIAALGGGWMPAD